MQLGRDITEAATQVGAVPCFPQGLGAGRLSWQRAWPCVWPVCSPLQGGHGHAHLWSGPLAKAVSCPV